MTAKRFRQQRAVRPCAERCDARFLLSGAAAQVPVPLVYHVHLVRPNTPIAPYEAKSSQVTFVDPSVRICNGQHVVIGQTTFVGPYAKIDARGGLIEVGSHSAVLDNSALITERNGPILIGDNVSIGFGATVRGPSQIGSASPDGSSPAAGVGPNALIDGAIVEPGAIVGALARVGPGVTVPSGYMVLPGKDVTTNAEASDPALGKVVVVSSDDMKNLTRSLSHDGELAQGYTKLYRGNSATGASAGDPKTHQGMYYGNVTTIEGTSEQPGATNGVSFEPPDPTGPRFSGPHSMDVQGLLATFPARITGDVRFTARPQLVAHRMGRRNAIRADDGQPFHFASPPRTGDGVTINSPLGSSTISYACCSKARLGGELEFGKNLRVGSGTVILGGPSPTDGSSGSSSSSPAYTVGDDVMIGAGAVIERSSIGSNVTIGSRSYISESQISDGAVIPPGTILVQNKVQGMVEW